MDARRSLMPCRRHLCACCPGAGNDCNSGRSDAVQNAMNDKRRCTCDYMSKNATVERPSTAAAHCNSGTPTYWWYKNVRDKGNPIQKCAGPRKSRSLGLFKKEQKRM